MRNAILGNNLKRLVEGESELHLPYFPQYDGIVVHRSCQQYPQNQRKQNRSLKEKKITKNFALQEQIKMYIFY